MIGNWLRRGRPVLVAMGCAGLAIVAISAFQRSGLITGAEHPTTLSIAPRPTMTVEVAPGATAVRTFTITNIGNVPVSLIGTKQSCGCVASDGLPADLAPGRSATVSFRLSAGTLAAGETGTRTSYLLTSQDDLVPRFDFNLSAKVASPK